MRVLAVVVMLTFTTLACGQESPPPITLPPAPVNWPELITLIGGIVIYVVNAVLKYLQDRQGIIATKANTDLLTHIRDNGNATVIQNQSIHSMLARQNAIMENRDVQTKPNG